MALTLVTLVSVLCWVWLLTARGGFWRADARLTPGPTPAAWPEVVAVIPARNEVETIARVVRAHLATEYPGRLSLVVVDDASDDGTAEAARAAAADGTRPVAILCAPPLTPGWSGKLNALAAGIAEAERRCPDAAYWLLTDADILHGPQTLGALVSAAETRDLALVSLMARLDDRGIWGGLLIPAFVFFFQKLYPFPLVNRPDHAEAAAAGGCILVRRETLAASGGIAAIRGALIDDCALAARIKATAPGHRIWLGLATGDQAVSLRDNRALSSVWTMVTRTAFTQLRQGLWRVAGSVAGMALLYLAGPLAVITFPWNADPAAALAGATAWALSAVAYAPTVSLYGQPRWRTLLLPLAAVLYGAMTIDSARRHLVGRGGAWKGRTYPA